VVQARILIVEDEPLTRDELRVWLDRDLSDCSFQFAETVTDARERLSGCSAPYDVILLDLKLPEVQGTEPEFNEDLFRLICDQRLSRLVIHTTGYPNDPEITDFILYRAFRRAAGPRSVFLPRINEKWAEDLVEVIRQAVAHSPPSALVQVRPTPSCFVSYAHEDERFVEKLYRRLSQARLNLWYAPKRMKPGLKMHDQIRAAVCAYDKFLLVLSEHSLQSPWVSSELRLAMEEERRSGAQKLIPVRLVDFDRIRSWSCFNADLGRDMAAELREYFIPDFRGWRSNRRFEAAASQLIAAIGGSPESLDLRKAMVTTDASR
jgi:hypothetical protein